MGAEGVRLRERWWQIVWAWTFCVGVSVDLSQVGGLGGWGLAGGSLADQREVSLGLRHPWQ